MDYSSYRDLLESVAGRLPGWIFEPEVSSDSARVGTLVHGSGAAISAVVHATTGELHFAGLYPPDEHGSAMTGHRWGVLGQYERDCEVRCGKLSHPSAVAVTLAAVLIPVYLPRYHLAERKLRSVLEDIQAREVHAARYSELTAIPPNGGNMRFGFGGVDGSNGTITVDETGGGVVEARLDRESLGRFVEFVARRREEL